MRLPVADTQTGLCAGDTVVVQRGQAALLLPNATVVRLDQGTTVTISPPAPGRPALLTVLSGAIYVITRTPQPFRVRTPFVNANVEGTEFLVEVRRGSEATGIAGCSSGPERAGEVDRIVVFEGQVRIDAEAGPFVLVAGEAAIASATQPPVKLTVRPVRDTVAWTLYVPTLVSSERPLAARFACATELLAQGRIEPAKQELQRLISQGGDGDAGAHALLATIAVAEGQLAEATRLSDRAVALDATLPAAWMSRSYAQQALFRIEEALASVDRAVSLDPANALALARRAELQLSLGRLDDALASAREAVRLDPRVARTQTVLGFANLLRIDLKAARASFDAAIALAPQDPLPRLGLGLVKIRQGDLAEGRADVELAVVLDPTQSLVRSYLGKAYFDERRPGLAGAQFRLAKELDPNDPTAWFYDSLRKESENQPIESVADLVESIRLNDRRAVYRSRLLLDDDLAARSASRARSYLEIDLREAATADAALALAIEPGSASTHRFLSDLKAVQPRHEITRASELLQAQMRQPLSVTPLQAQLSSDRLFSLRSEGPNAAGFNEFGSLFLSNGPGAQLQGVLGNHDTSGAQGLFSFIHDQVGVGISALRFSTQGTRPNGDSNESAQSGLVQWAISPDTSVQMELAHRRREYGDIVSRFDPEAFGTERNTEHNDDLRLGLRHSFDPSSNVLVAFNRRDDQVRRRFGISVRTRSSRQRPSISCAPARSRSSPA